jgi:tetratricopeptide (TPR) repeat protein
VHYYHHLVDFHCAVTRNGPEAIQWARKDVEIRNNFSTQSALAWALHVGGEHAEALEWIEHALQSGVIDARLFSNAATIYDAAGQNQIARGYRARALELNPRLGSFHTHHH